MMMLIVIIVIQLLIIINICNCYKNYNNIKFKHGLYARNKSKISNDNDDNKDNFLNDFNNLSDNTNLNKKLEMNSIIYENMNLNAQQQKELIQKNIEEVKRVASMFSLSPSSSTTAAATKTTTTTTSRGTKKSLNNINFNDDNDEFSNNFDMDIINNDSNNNYGDDNNEDVDETIASTKKKRKVSKLALEMINDIEANKDSVEFSNDNTEFSNVNINNVFVSPRDKARENLLKQLTEPFPEYDGPLCPKCSRPSSNVELESFGGKCSICRQEELSEPDINLEYRYRLREMKERRNTILNKSVDVKNYNKSSENDIDQNKSSENDIDQNIKGKTSNKSNVGKSRWPEMLQTGIEFETNSMGTSINRNKLKIVSFNKQIDDENYDDNSYMDQYSNMDIDSRVNRRADVSDDIWERFLGLEDNVESIGMAVDALSTLELQIGNMMGLVIKLEEKFKELELKYDLLLRKFQKEIKKKNESLPP